MYDAILVPSNGSDSSTVAVEQSVAIADGEAATVHFFHVVDVGTVMSAGASESIAPRLTETLEDEAESALDDAASRAEETGIAYDRVTREGNSHEVIAAYSAAHEIDLVVMGASGRSGMKERLLGSTTDRVVCTVDTSVPIARA